MQLRGELRLKGIRIKNLLLLSIAGIVNAFGITLFLYPVKLYDSGVSGTSMLLAQITPDYMSLSLFLLLLNIPLFLYGLKRQGKTFTIYSTFTVIVYSIVAWLITDVLPIDVSIASPLAGTDLLLCAIFGGVISGIGSGIAIRYGGAIDGLEVMAVIFAKGLGVTVGTFCMVYNVILYVLCGMVVNSWILPLYSIVTYFANSKTVDFIVEGLQRAKGAMIVTTKAEEIGQKLMEEFETGVTKLAAKGGYSNTDKTVIYFVVNRFQVTKMKELVHEVDPLAFITINEIVDVFMVNQDR